MSNGTYLTDDGLYPSPGGMLGNGFLTDADPLRSVLLIQPNKNETAPIDRSRSGAVPKTLTARNGARLTDSVKRYGSAALELKRATKQWVEITPPGDFAIGTRPFTIAVDLYPTTDGVRQVVFSSGPQAGGYSLSYEADKTVAFAIVGGTTLKTSVSFDKGRHVHVEVARTAGNALVIRLEGKTYATQAGVTTALTADATRVFLGAGDAAGADSFDGVLDGLQVAVGEVLHSSDFGDGVGGAAPIDAFYVDPVNGLDANSGALATPFKTLVKARDAMRASSTVKTTILRGGRHDLSAAPLALTAADSNTVWRAFTGETPVLSGAEKLTGFLQEPGGLYSKTATLTDLDLIIGDTRQRCAMSGAFNPADPYKTGWLFCPTDGSTTTIPFAAGAVTSAELEAGVKVQAFDRDRLSDHIGAIASITAGTAAAASWPVLPSGITATKWVDGTNGNDSTGDGSSGAPWKTLQKAASTATAGTCVMVKDGVYAGNISQTANGTSANPIVFCAENKHGARIVQPSSSGSDTCIDSRGHYVHWLGFEIDGSTYSTGTRWRIGIYITGTNARAAWNKVHDLQTQSGGNTVSGAAIYGDYFYGNLNQIVEFNTVYNIGPVGTTSSNLQCLYMSGTGRVNGNLVYRFVGAAVHGWHAARSLEVYNNTVDDGYIAYFVGFDAGETYNGFPGPAQNCVFKNNIASNCQYGYAEYQSTGPNTYDTNLAYNCTTPWRLLNGNTHSNDLTGDPLYVNRSARDYRLQAASPAVGTATTGATPTQSIDLFPRPMGGTLDLGAFEYAAGGSGQGVITTASAMQYTIRQGSTFRLLNRAAYIRNPAEFGWRASDGKLVIRPAAATFEADGVYVPRQGDLVQMVGTTGTTWTGITFAHATWTGTAVRLTAGANGNTFDGCTWAHVGCAFRANASNQNTVKNGKAYSLGWGGFYFENNADANTVTKMVITDVGTVLKGGMAVGGNDCTNTVVTNNEINRSARYGVSFKSFDAGTAHSGNRIEYNRIENCLLESADGGAVESLGRANNNTALSVKGNFINIARGLATSNTGTWLDGYKGFGVYLDDMTNGATVRDNLIRGTSWASVFVHGGDNNVITNNTIIGSTTQEMAFRLEWQPAGGSAGTPANNSFTKNLIYYSVATTAYFQPITPGTFTVSTNWLFNCPARDASDKTGDPLFVDAATQKWALKTASPVPAGIGFADLPYGSMGLAGIDMGDPASGGGGTTNPPPDTGGGTTNPPPTGTGYPSNKGGFLVSGNQILDGAMKPVRFTGANLSGAEWNDSANSFGLIPGGATARNYKASLDQIKALGFNLIRLCFADSTIVSTRTRHGYAEGPNPEFIGKTPLQILGMYCQYARQIGLYVLLDHHRNNASTGSGTQVNFLGGDGFTLTDIINNWKTLVTHPDIFGNPAVMGCDVHNEPNGRAFDWTTWSPAAAQIANAIHSVNPNLLVIVEGNEISYSQGGEAWGWWGGNLRDYDTRPLAITRTDKIVLSTHEYGPYLVGPKPYHNVADFPANMFGTANYSNLRGVWDFFFGYLWRAKRFPILVGELGAKFEDPTGQKKEFDWMRALHRYMNGELNGDGQMFLGAGEVGMSWTMWAMNPTSGDTGGIWQNDWVTVATNRYNMYKDQLWKGTITPPPQIRVDGTRI